MFMIAAPPATACGPFSGQGKTRMERARRASPATGPAYRLQRPETAILLAATVIVGAKEAVMNWCDTKCVTSILWLEP